jgi:uncharacterized membrane protein YqgA involved in biofilm formation
VILGLAISSLLEIKPIRTGNLLPALLLAPIVVFLLETIAPMIDLLRTP